MKGKSSVLLASLLLSLSVVSGIVFLRYRDVNNQNRMLRVALREATDEIQRMKGERPIEGSPLGVPQPDWARLKKEGRPDPRCWLVKDLLAREDLIPWEGIHGGTMKIYDPSLVWFTGPKWCVAWAEDGHIGGFMLLRFEEGDDEKPRWRLLDSTLAD